MLTINDVEFGNEFRKMRGRRPVQLAHIHVGGIIYYLSDISIVVDGNTYEPWIESWGTLSDSSDLDSLFGGQSIGFRVGNITIINSKKSKSFIDKITHHGVDNAKVKLYQFFSGNPALTKPFLLDTFVARDPITINENSMLFSFDIVSDLAATNRKLFPTSPGEDNFPVIIGKVDSVPVTLSNRTGYCILEQEITASQTGDIKFSSTDRMPPSGKIRIDSETLTYSSKTKTTLRISARGSGALPHSPGSMSPLEGTKFRYNVCAGPVFDISRVLLAGNDVTSQVTINKTSNPAWFQFNDGWPPHYGVTDKSSISTDTTSYNDVVKPRHQNSMLKHMAYSHDKTVNGVGDWGGVYSTDFPPAKNIGGPYRCKVRIKHQIKAMAVDTRVRVIFGYSAKLNPSQLTDILAITISEFSAKDGIKTESIISVGDLTHSQLRSGGGSNWRFVVVIEVISGTSCTFNVQEPVMEINYDEKKSIVELEKKRVFGNESDLTCDVVGITPADVSPPSLLNFLISNYTDCKHQIDTVDFSNENARYSSAGYFFNGVLPPGIKVKEAIKIVLQEGLARLKYSQGKIQIVSYFDDNSTTVDSIITNDDILQRSRGVEHFSSDRIKNNIHVRYGFNFSTNEYDGVVKESDSESIAKYQKQDADRDLTLVSSLAVAKLYASTMLKFLREPPKIFSVLVFMPKGFELEKGDRVKVKHFLNNHHIITGNILSIERSFGKGKERKINTWKVMITGFETSSELDLEDTIIIDDADFDKTTFFNLPTETIILDGVFGTGVHKQLILSEYVVIDGSALSSGRVLHLFDVIALDDSDQSNITAKTLAVPTDTINLDDHYLDHNVDKDIEVSDTIIIDDSHYEKDLVLLFTDTIEVEGKETVSVERELDLVEELIVSDLLYTHGALKVLSLVDEIVLHSEMKHYRELTLTDTVIIDSTQTELNTCAGYGDCGFGSKGYGE